MKLCWAGSCKGREFVERSKSNRFAAFKNDEIRKIFPLNLSENDDVIVGEILV